LSAHSLHAGAIIYFLEVLVKLFLIPVQEAIGFIRFIICEKAVILGIIEIIT
jgi:hypothetical protein